MMKNRFKKAACERFESVKETNPGLLTEENIAHLPDIVQKYLRFTGSVDNEKIFSWK